MPTHRYTFAETADLESVESSLLLSVWATKALHGESRFCLDTNYQIQRQERVILIDANSQSGRDLNCIFLGYLHREFSRDDFDLTQINPATPAPGT